MKRENKLIYGLVGCALILLVTVCFWGSPKRTYTGKMVSEDWEAIVQEVPLLELSEDEVELYEALKQNPKIQALMENVTAEQSDAAIVLEESLSCELAGHLLPQGAENVGMQTEASTVVLSYWLLNMDIKICYPMAESEEIVKILSVFEKDTDTICKFQYVNYGNERFEKYKTVRVWFPWQIGE